MKNRFFGMSSVFIGAIVATIVVGCEQKAEESAPTGTTKLTKPVDQTEGTIQTIEPVNSKQKKP